VYKRDGEQRRGEYVPDCPFLEDVTGVEVVLKSVPMVKG